MRAWSEENDLEILVDKKLLKIAYCTRNFDDIPPIIGVITADQYGNTIVVFEHDYKDGDDRGPITSYLSENDKNLNEIDLISMYFSSLKIFAGQNNIQNLSHLEIHGSNIKVQIYYLCEKYMIIGFLNSNTDLSSQEKAELIRYMKNKLITHANEFQNFNQPSARIILGKVESAGKLWLKRFNARHLHEFNRNYLEKNGITEQIINEIDPIIKKELKDYLEKASDEFVDDLSKEIKNKIQDKLFSRFDFR